MVTVGFDFGTHQTKICFETVEAGTTFYEVFRFATPSGVDELTLPSFIRLCADGMVRYGHDAVVDDAEGIAITYFKQKMFSLTAAPQVRDEAKQLSVLYLAFIIFKLDAHFHGSSYAVHMGMPTDADHRNYDFCKRQAVTAMSSAMLLVRKCFHGDLKKFLCTPYAQLAELVQKCMCVLPTDPQKIQASFPILVFPEAYAALIPLINDRKLPTIGPSLFVDIGGGTVDISFFTNQMDKTVGRNRPRLYYYHSVAYGLNMITGQDINHCHNVRVWQNQITRDGVEGFRKKLKSAVDAMMKILGNEYERIGKTELMPFQNMCSQMLEGRPICYSGGGSMFPALRLPITRNGEYNYEFSDVKTVSGLIDHSKLYVSDEMFHVLATAFALCHQSLIDRNRKDPDGIALVSVDRLFEGVRLPCSMPDKLYPSIVTRYGTVDPAKYNHAIVLQSAESGDMDAQRRVEIGDLAEARLKRIEEEKGVAQKQNQHIAEIHRKFDVARREHERRIEDAKKAFAEGDRASAIKVAKLILTDPAFSGERFEEARDWLNLAKKKGVVSMMLLAQFASVCRNGDVPDSKKHLCRYEQIIADCRAGRYVGLTFCDD